MGTSGTCVGSSLDKTTEHWTIRKEGPHEKNRVRVHWGRFSAGRLLAAAAVAAVIASPLVVPMTAHGETYAGSLSSVESASVSSDQANVVDVTFNDGVQGKDHVPR